MQSLQELKKYKSIIKKNDEIVLLWKSKINAIEIVVSNVLIDTYSSHDKFVSANNVLWEYNEMKEEIKIPETSVEYII